MRLAPVIAAGIISVAGSLLGKLLDKGGKSKGQIDQTTTGSSTPSFDPRFEPLLNMLLGRSRSQLSTGSALPPGFATNAVEGINSAFSGSRANLESSLTARGLGSSPVAAPVLAGQENARAAAIGDLGVKLPLLEQEQRGLV